VVVVSVESDVVSVDVVSVDVVVTVAVLVSCAVAVAGCKYPRL
jgi:hypothetical protein